MQKAFQSPRSGKFESNAAETASDFVNDAFQSPRSGKFESNKEVGVIRSKRDYEFQSPRSGKFESNIMTTLIV